ncbi:MAG: hypothetical protein ACRELS_03600 [Candidatus Rokuibacteriota bacterium]
MDGRWTSIARGLVAVAMLLIVSACAEAPKGGYGSAHVAASGAVVGCEETISSTTRVVAGGKGQGSPLEAADQLFHEEYAKSRAVLWARTRPIIVVEFENVVLLRKSGPPLAAAYAPPIYHRYKEIGHVPMAIFAIVSPAVDGPERPWQEPLTQLHGHVMAARARIAEFGFPVAHRAAQDEILRRSADFIAGTLRAGKIDGNAVQAFTRDMAPRVLAGADLAAASQLAQLHTIVSGWRQTALTPAEWEQVYVVVLGFKMPREGYTQYQYFERVLGAQQSGRRLIYAEGLARCADAMSLLGTMVLDRRVATSFFADVWRMDRDLMSDGARKYLDGLFGPR